MQTFESIRNRLQSQAAGRFNCPPEKLKQEHRLFIDWMASELGILHRDLTRSDDAIQKRIADRLRPDTGTRPLPEHALAYAQPRNGNGYTLRPEEDILNIDRLGFETPKTLFFAPLAPVPLVKARVKYIAAGQSLNELADYNNSFTLFKTLPGHAFHPGVVWLAVQLEGALKNPGRLSFYMDWNLENPERKQALYRNLPLVKWYCDNRPLAASSGLYYDESGADRHQSRHVDEEFLHLYAIEKNMLEHYANKFVTITEAEFKPGPPPEEVKANFEDTAFAEQIKEDMIWFRLVFPAGFYPEEVGKTIAQLNCFPVVNRKLDRSRDFTPTGNDGLEVIALSNADKGRAALQEIGAFFLGMQRVFTRNADFKPVAFDQFRNASAGYYALQRGRVEASDFRDLYGRIAELTRIIRNHTSTLILLDQHQITQAMRTIGQGAEEMESALRDIPPKDQDLGYYLHLRIADPREMVYVRFWLTQGEYARGVCRSGERLTAERGQVLEGDVAWVV